MSAHAVLVTGANGFIGQHLCVALARRGDSVRAVVRAGAGPMADHLPVILESMDGGSLRAAMAGVDSVVHLAGRAHVLEETSADPLAEFRKANVELTRTVLSAAMQSGVARFVFLSSAAVIGNRVSPIDDFTPERPDTAYGVSKLEAERLVLAAAGAANGMSTVILRPPLVYGPRMRGNPLQFWKLIATGLPLPLAGLHNRRSVAYVGNLVSALTATIDQRSSMDFRPYCVADYPALSVASHAQGVAGALGVKVRLFYAPPAALRAVGQLGDVARRWVKFPVGKESIERLSTAFEVETSRFRLAYALPAPQPHDEGFRETARWFRDGSTQ